MLEKTILLISLQQASRHLMGAKDRVPIQDYSREHSERNVSDKQEDC